MIKHFKPTNKKTVDFGWENVLTSLNHLPWWRLEPSKTSKILIQEINSTKFFQWCTIHNRDDFCQTKPCNNWNRTNTSRVEQEMFVDVYLRTLFVDKYCTGEEDAPCCKFAVTCKWKPLFSVWKMVKVQLWQVLPTKSKITTKRRVWGANLEFDLQSESYRSIVAIIQFYDA